LESVTDVGPSDLTSLYSTRLVAVAADYVEQERLKDLRASRSAFAGRLDGWSASYTVVYRLEKGELVGWCSEGKSRCRHLAALLYAWVHRRAAFVPVAERLRHQMPGDLRRALTEALFAPDPAEVLLSLLGGALDPAQRAAEAASLPPRRLLEAYFDSDAATAAALLPQVLARQDELDLETAAGLALARIFQSRADGDDEAEVGRRYLALFPAAEVAEVLLRHRLTPPAQVVATLRLRGRREEALAAAELALLGVWGQGEREALLEEALLLAEGLPGRRQRYLEELVLLGREGYLAAWLHLSPSPAQASAFARRLAQAGQTAAAVRVLLHAGDEEAVLPLLTPSLPTDVLLAAARRLGRRHPGAIASLLHAAAGRAQGRDALRLARAARRWQGNA
jgi:hypothetical protein